MEKDIPFGQSVFWEQQRNFYNNQGIEAWAGKVPYYITNTTFLAEAYFQTIVSFWLESSLQPAFTKKEPFYVVEFGAGPGLFSFYLLQRLYKWREESQPDFSFVYIMTDLAASNVGFWKDHPTLQFYIEKEVLDFAVWDVESTTPLITDLKNIELSARNPAKNAFVAVANYLLDSLRYEFIRLEKGEVLYGCVNEQTLPENFLSDAEHTLESFFANLYFLPLHKDKLEEERNILHKTITAYSASKENCDFFFPSGAITFFKNIRTISNHNLLMLITDKGNYKHKNLILNFKPGVVWHHSVSIDVPFDILARWATETGGEAVITETSQAVQNAGFLLTPDNSAFPHTLHTLKNQFLNHPSGTIYTMFRFYAGCKNALSLTDIISCLNIMQWDPFVFNELFPVLVQYIKSQQEPLLMADLVDGLQKIADHYYYLPDMDNTLANIGIIFQELSNFKVAIYYYKRSLAEFGDMEATRFNIATCCIALKEWAAAKEWLEAIVVENPENFTARGYLAYCLDNN